MKLAKTLAVVACAGLLSTGAIGSGHRVFAQDAGTADPEAGSWSADTDNLQEPDSEPNTAKSPLDVQGCWSGKVHDKAEGTGTINLSFAQNGTVLEPFVGGFQVVWNAHNFAQGPIVSGSVSSKGVMFKGTATKKCSISARGTGSADKISGTYSFQKECARAFKGGTFSITPGPC